MSGKYYFRIDDIFAGLDWHKFNRLVEIFDRYGVKPIIGVIPDNRDGNLSVGADREDFWDIIAKLARRGWIVAQHGYQHIYKTKDGGLLNINKKSEFAGMPYEAQLEALSRGREILKNKLGFFPKWFMAPAHSLDENTCYALVMLGFTHITDGIALFPYKKFGLTWVPQQLWRPKKKYIGQWTICLHPNTLREDDILKIERFIKKNKKYIGSFSFPSAQSSFLSNAFRISWYLQYNMYKIWKKVI